MAMANLLRVDSNCTLRPILQPTAFYPHTCRHRPFKASGRHHASQICAHSVGQRLRRRGRSTDRCSTIAHGILDAYRKDKGLLERQREAFRQSNVTRQSTAQEEDDEVCPAECVKEIKEGASLQYFFFVHPHCISMPCYAAIWPRKCHRHCMTICVTMQLTNLTRHWSRGVTRHWCGVDMQFTRRTYTVCCGT